MDSLDNSLHKKTMFQRAMTAGLLITGVSILVNLVFYVTGMDMEMLTNPGISWINRILLIGANYYFIHVALKQFRDNDQDGFLGVGQGIGLGSLAGLVSGVLSALWFFIFTNFIATDMMDKIKEITMQQMQEKGQSSEQAEKAMEMMSFFFSPGFMAVIVVISGVFFGFLCGLVAGLILKKEKQYM